MPTDPGFEVTVKRGNAVDPCVVIDVQKFHTEFAARLFGWLASECDQYRYWFLSGHMA